MGLVLSFIRYDIMLVLESFNLDIYFKVILFGEEFLESKFNLVIYNRVVEFLDIFK